MLRHGDMDLARLTETVAHVRRIREQGPRAGDRFDVQLLLYSWIGGDEAEARRMLAPFVSARARTSTRSADLPPDLHDGWKRYSMAYDYAHHASAVNQVNSELMATTGLADYFFDRYCVYGDEQRILSTLARLENAGITATTMGGPPDRAAALLRAYRAQFPKSAIPDPSSLRPLR
jgi:alkanesulfonate monooxygenase SsuD/methylene tetrahydromethanopterin reductase-like flavin-dependent oxidoreductase (luciferase family)